MKACHESEKKMHEKIVKGYVESEAKRMRSEASNSTADPTLARMETSNELIDVFERLGAKMTETERVSVILAVRWLRERAEEMTLGRKVLAKAEAV